MKRHVKEKQQRQNIHLISMYFQIPFQTKYVYRYVKAHIL